MKYAKRRIPVGDCPNCGRPVVYSDNGSDKKYISVICVDDDYVGHTQICAKCKTMVAVIENRQFGISVIGVVNA